MDTILITGANGFVPYYIIEKLLRKKCLVIATGKGECRLPYTKNNFIYESMDFTVEDAIKKIFEKHQPSVIIHSGAVSKPDDCAMNKEAAVMTNVTSTSFLMKEAAALKAYFMFLSTDFIFDGEKGMYKEDDDAAPVNFYGETKLEAEKLVKQYAFDWSIVRTVLVYGDPQSGRDNIISNVVKALKEERGLKIFKDQVRTPTYVEDLAGAIVKMVEEKIKGVFHISGEDVLTPYDMAVATARLMNKNEGLIEAVTEADFQQPARRPLKTGFDLTKAKQQLQYHPISFEEGLKKTLTSMGVASINSA